MHKALALFHHHLAILVETGVHEWLQQRCERRHPAWGGPEYLIYLGRLLGDRRNRCKPHDGVALAMHLLDAQPRKLVGNLRFDVSPEQLVHQILWRQLMAHHSPAEFDWLELLLFRAQLSRLMLEPPRRMHKAGMRRIHETESGVVGRAGEWQHDRRQRRSIVGKDRHARRLRRARSGFIRRREIDPHQTLPLDAPIGSATNLSEIHYLGLP